MEGKFGAYKINTTSFLVLLVAYNLSNSNEIERIVKSVKDIRVYPDWNTNVDIFDVDIALLILESEIEFTKFIQPICIAEPTSGIIEPLHGTVVGFGRMGNRQYADIAQKLNISIISYLKCSQISKDIHSVLTSRAFCGGTTEGRGVCDGDSGGGVYVVKNQQFYLYGIVSSALMSKVNQCDTSTYSIFTNVEDFFYWIKSDGTNKYAST